MMTRPMMSEVGDQANAQTGDPPQKMTTPINITFLRPKLSPSEPQINVRLAKAPGHPLELRHAGVQFGLHARENGAGDGVVEEREKQNCQERREAEVGL